MALSVSKSSAAASSLGARFVNSEAWRTFRADNPRYESKSGKPMHVVMKDEDEPAAGSDPVTDPVTDPEPTAADPDPAPTAADLALNRPTAKVQAVRTTILPGIEDRTTRGDLNLLNLITKGTAASPWLKYRALVSYTSNSAIVPEKGEKPLSTLTTATFEATSYTYADGITVTSQEVRDDAVLVALIDQFLTANLQAKIEDIVLNGTGSDEPTGILNASGIQTYVAATDGATGDDVFNTIRKARDLLRAVHAPGPVTVVLSVADAQALDLMRDGTSRFYGTGPYTVGDTPRIWGLPIVVSDKLTTGTALMGHFQTVQLLQVEGLKVEVFNQHEDFARKNLLYVRAETDQLMLHRMPAAMVKITL